MRLIDAENLLKEYERIDWYSVSKNGQFTRGATTEDNPFIRYYNGEEIIKNAPTIDAAPVVRCRDCKHAWIHPCGYVYCHRDGRNAYEMTFNLDSFCSYGERKDNG